MTVGLEPYQLRSFLLLSAVGALLEKNRFAPVKAEAEGIRRQKGLLCEIRGRAEWHDVDDVYAFMAPMPFGETLRLCMQARFFDRRISKPHMREFIGIMKDVGEVYLNQRFLDAHAMEKHRDQGIFFAMNGFTPEAEHLGAAHGIQTISYADQPLMGPIASDIVCLSSLILETVSFHDHGEIHAFLRQLRHQAASGDEQLAARMSARYGEELGEQMRMLHAHLSEIRTSLIATAKGGTYLHVLSVSAFPLDQFLHTDEGSCQIHMEKHGRRRHYYFTVNDTSARFYFTCPAYLNVGRLLGTAAVQQQSLFAQDPHDQGFLQLCVRDEGIMRFLRLQIDPRLWVD